jgi:hypothetical protein
LAGPINLNDMTKKIACFIIIQMLFLPALYSQVKFRSVSSVGLLNGSAGPSLLLETIAGLSYKNSFAGVGVALDHYRFRTVPLFIGLRQAFGKGSRSLFVYGNAGYHFDWLTEENEKRYNVFSTNNNYSGSIYYDAGVGYSFGFKKADALLFSAGFSYKEVKSTSANSFCPIVAPCNTDVQIYRYRMPRLVLKAGWRF